MTRWTIFELARAVPLGASGARLICSLLSGLQQEDWRNGRQAMGEANATTIERL